MKDGAMQGQISIFEALRMAVETFVDEAVETERPAEETPEEVPEEEAVEAAGAVGLKPLTLEQLAGLKPFSSLVWIENRDRGCMDNPAVRFLRLFQARFIAVAIPIDDERKSYQFDYTYTDGRKYWHNRLDVFYGQEWRVWPEKPGKEEMEGTAWE